MTFNLPASGRKLWLLSAYLMLLLSLGILAGLRRRPATAVFGLTVVVLLFATACSTGGSQAGVPAGTPAGTSVPGQEEFAILHGLGHEAARIPVTPFCSTEPSVSVQ